MHPDEIRLARRGVSLHKIMQRLPQPVAEREGERWTTVTHALLGNFKVEDRLEAVSTVLGRRERVWTGLARGRVGVGSFGVREVV